MHYKTIVLELLQQRPKLHEQLRQNRQLLPTLEHYSRMLKERHEELIILLQKTLPERDPAPIPGETLEIALQELQEALPSDLPPSDEEPLSLDAAMAFLLRPTPSA